MADREQAKQGDSSKERGSEGQRVSSDVAQDHEASTNQLQHEPMPASRHDEAGQEAEKRNAEHSAAAGRRQREKNAAHRRSKESS
jgi:hypothetical protein